MSLSFIQWEKYIQGFPDDRLGQEFQDPGSTVAGSEKPPQAIIITEMGNRNAARKADEAVRASQGQPAGTIAEQTYGEFAGEGRPIGGPGGGPPPGGPPMGPGGPPPGGPPMGPGGPPMGGPPMGGPPMMAYGGSVPGYQYGGSVPGYQDGGDTEGGGFLRGLGSFLTGADSLEDAAENPWRTAGHTALSAASVIPGLGLAGWAGRGALGLAKGRRLQQLVEAAGRGTLALRNQGGKRQALARLLDPVQARSKTPGWLGGRSGSWITDSKTGEKIWDAGAGMKSGFSQIGMRSIGRGGGALGVASLLALDPFEGPKPTPENTAPPPNTKLTDSSAIRADREKSFAGGGYDWLGEETQSEQNVRQLVDYRNKGIASGDFPENFQDRASRAFLDRMDQRLAGYVAPAQGYATLPQMASGDTTRLGYHEGGNIPIHEHGSGPDQHLVGNRNPGPPWGRSITNIQMTGQPFMADTLYTSPEGVEGYLADEARALRSGPTLRDIIAEERAMREGLTGADEAKAIAKRGFAQMDEDLASRRGGSSPVSGDGAYTPSHYEQERLWREYVARRRLGPMGDPTIGQTPPLSVMSQVPDSLASDEVSAAIADTVPQTTRGMDSGPGQGMSPRRTAPMAAAGSDQPWQYGDEVPEGFKAVLGWSDDLATPEGSWRTGERNIFGDINRSFNRVGAEARGFGQDLGEVAKEIYEAFGVGQQFGPDQRNAQGRLLRSGAVMSGGQWKDSESFDPDKSGRSGNQEWTLVPISEEEIAAGSPGGPGGPGGPVASGPSSQASFGPADATAASAMVDDDLIREAKAYETELRLQNPEEVARDDYWESRRRREQDNSFSLLAADVASAISGSGGISGNIGKGLADATRNQIEQGRRIMDLEELPFTANVERSRRSTFDSRMNAMDSIATRLAARGQIDATVAGRLREMEMTLRESNKSSAEKVLLMQQMLQQAVLEGMDAPLAALYMKSYRDEFLESKWPSSATR